MLIKYLKKNKPNCLKKIKFSLIYTSLSKIVYMIIIVAISNLNLVYYHNFLLYIII